jgi:hypothetical protein
MIYDLNLETDLNLLFGFIGAQYLIQIHFKLIKVTEGKLKKKIKLILTGQILIILSMFIATIIPELLLFQEFEDFLNTLAIQLINLSILITFPAIYRMHDFLDLDWKHDLVKLFILNQNTNEIMYSSNFSFLEDREIIFDNDDEVNKLLSGGIVGINDIIAKIIKSNRKKIYRMKQQNILILLEYGENSLDFLIFALLVRKEFEPFYIFLRRLKHNFLEIYKELPLLGLNKNIDKSISSDYDLIIEKILKDMTQ